MRARGPNVRAARQLDATRDSGVAVHRRRLMAIQNNSGTGAQRETCGKRHSTILKHAGNDRHEKTTRFRGNGFAEMVALRTALFLSLRCKQWVTIVAVDVIKRVQNTPWPWRPLYVCGSLSPNPHPPLDRGLDYPPDVHWWPMRWPKGGIDQNRLGTPIHLSLAGRRLQART